MKSGKGRDEMKTLIFLSMFLISNIAHAEVDCDKKYEAVKQGPGGNFRGNFTNTEAYELCRLANVFEKFLELSTVKDSLTAQKT